jgi:hypothetical protein
MCSVNAGEAMLDHFLGGSTLELSRFLTIAAIGFQSEFLGRPNE